MSARSAWRCARSTSSRARASRRSGSTTAPAPIPIPQAAIDIMSGLPELRRDWIRGRGDVEEVLQREVRPEDNGQLGPDRSGGVQAFPNVRKTVLRARPGANVRRCTTPGRESSRRRWNMSRSARIWAANSSPLWTATARISAPPSPITSPPNSSATRSPAAAPSSLPTSTTRKASRWRSAATSWSRSTPISATAPSPPTSPPRSTRWSGRSAGAPTR